MSVQGKQQDVEASKVALDHAWAWFSLHATQRLQSVNFFLIAVAFLSAAFVTAAKEELFALAAGVALLGAFTSYIFYRMELRIRSLIHAAEHAIQPLQDGLAKTLQIDELRIVSHVEVEKPGEWKYSKVFRYLYFYTGNAFVLGFLYVSWEGVTGGPLAPAFNLILQTVMGVFLVVYGYEMLLTAQQQPKPTTQINRVFLILGAICVIVGITIICHLVFIRL